MSLRDRVAHYVGAWGWWRDPYPPAQPAPALTRPRTAPPTPEAAPTITQAPAGTTGTPPTSPFVPRTEFFLNACPDRHLDCTYTTRFAPTRGPLKTNHEPAAAQWARTEEDDLLRQLADLTAWCGDATEAARLMWGEPDDTGQADHDPLTAQIAQAARLIDLTAERGAYEASRIMFGGER
jgi:hypothetical protein